MQLEKTYDPQRFESHWAQWWVEAGVFRADPKVMATTHGIQWYRTLRRPLPFRESTFRTPTAVPSTIMIMEHVSMERIIEVAGISDDLLVRLDERARQIGVDRNAYVRKLIERAVAPPSAAATLGELLAPLHDFTDAHGISDREIERFFNDQLSESRRQRRRAEKGGRTT